MKSGFVQLLKNTPLYLIIQEICLYGTLRAILKQSDIEVNEFIEKK